MRYVSEHRAFLNRISRCKTIGFSLSLSLNQKQKELRFDTINARHGARLRRRSDTSFVALSERLVSLTTNRIQLILSNQRIESKLSCPPARSAILRHHWITYRHISNIILNMISSICRRFLSPILWYNVLRVRNERARQRRVLAVPEWAIVCAYVNDIRFLFAHHPQIHVYIHWSPVLSAADCARSLAF